MDAEDRGVLVSKVGIAEYEVGCSCAVLDSGCDVAADVASYLR
jgi:hypothetical protein